MRLTLILSALLVLAGCSTTAPDPAPSAVDAAQTAADEAAAAADEAAAIAACTASGGQMQPLGRLQRKQCVVAYADAGKSCSSKSDCSGQCLARGDEELAPGAKATGTCQRDVSQNFGCRQHIDGGVAQSTICVD